ncbi:MAG: EFR1 family ferrodoxin [Acidaminococcaceae bacterium]|nr:EFR1 family ferrodoxin [Acidaminococcaceae bacterium]
MIIYFSGTGNSYSVAVKLAAALNDRAVPLIRLQEEPDAFDLKREAKIGIVFPVYFGDIPQPLEDYLQTAAFNSSTYFYSVATCGGSFGVSLYHLREILKKRNCRLSYGRVCYMIANSTATWKKEVAYDYRKLDGEAKLVKETAQAVTDRKVDTSLMKPSLAGKIMASGFVKKLGMKRFAVSVDPAHCVGCGICASICPAHNITLQNQKAVTGSHCAHCMACVHACPHGGMLVNGHSIDRKNRYRHPEVEIKDLVLR